MLVEPIQFRTSRLVNIRRNQGKLVDPDKCFSHAFYLLVTIFQIYTSISMGVRIIMSTFFLCSKRKVKKNFFAIDLRESRSLKEMPHRNAHLFDLIAFEAVIQCRSPEENEFSKKKTERKKKSKLLLGWV